MNSTAQLARDPQAHLPTGPTHVVHRSAGPRTTPPPRASNAPLAWGATADVPPSAKRLNTFLAKRARYAMAAEGDRKVAEGEIFCYWSQKKTAAKLGWGVRHVKMAFRHLRDAGGWESRQRVRPYGASYVFVGAVIPSEIPSVIPSEIPSHREPRTEEPRRENHRKKRTKRSWRGDDDGFTQVSASVLPPQAHGPTQKQLRKLRKLSKRHDEQPITEDQAKGLIGHDIANTITRLEQLEGVVERRTEDEHEHHRRREQHNEQRNQAINACSHHWLPEGYCGQCGSEKGQSTA